MPCTVPGPPTYLPLTPAQADVLAEHRRLTYRLAELDAECRKLRKAKAKTQAALLTALRGQHHRIAPTGERIDIVLDQRAPVIVAEHTRPAYTLVRIREAD